MRKLFIVLAKFMGFWMLYSAFLMLISLPSFTKMAGENSTNSYILSLLIVWAVNIVLELIFGWLLLIKTEWLANEFKIEAGDNLPAFNNEAVLRTGLKIIGVYLAVFAIPKYVSRLGFDNYKDLLFWTRLIGFLFSLGAGFFLAFKTEKIINLISDRDRETEST